MRVLSSDLKNNIGKEVVVKGWVHSRRDHGGLVFIDIRDDKGLVQLVVQPETESPFLIAEGLRDEFVISAKGIVVERSEDLRNPQIETGSIEIVVEEIEILNRSDPLPIQVNSIQDIGEDQRLKYRYLDLRRPKMQEILKKRSEMYRMIRMFMEERDFIEVSTPIIANSSPEGARDFLIPSRIHPGTFYALPQAPQQFKQLLMVGGVPRYYQIAACFRDEDPRADRLYGEFHQLDLEVSFVEDGEKIRQTMEPLVKKLVVDFASKKLAQEDIPRIPYHESMDRFGTDKPDLRFGMELIDLSEDLIDCGFGVFSKAIKDGGVVKAICVKQAFGLSRSQIDKFTELAKQEGAGGLAYMAIENNAVVSPIAKFFNDAELDLIQKNLSANNGDMLFFGADSREIVNKVLGKLRSEFADYFKLKDPNVIALAWIIDFPFYEWDEKEKKLDFGHNPFSMPIGGSESLDKEDKLSILADQYDMVMNGYEICSGAVRNHNPDVMYKAFAVLGYDMAYVDSKFGAMINAFKYGAPPHAGCAFGIDRMLMELLGENNVREVVAFPKNGSGVDVMMHSPSDVDPRTLDELKFRLNRKKLSSSKEDE